MQFVGSVLRQKLAQRGALAPPLLRPLPRWVPAPGDVARMDARRRAGVVQADRRKRTYLQEARIDAAAPTVRPIAIHKGFAATRKATHAEAGHDGIPQHELVGAG